MQFSGSFPGLTESDFLEGGAREYAFLTLVVLLCTALEGESLISRDSKLEGSLWCLSHAEFDPLDGSRTWYSSK